MKHNRILDIVNSYQSFALGWLFATLIVPTLFTRIVGFIFVNLLILNRCYQLKLKYG